MKRYYLHMIQNHWTREPPLPTPVLFPPKLRTSPLYTVQKASGKCLCNKRRQKMPVVWLRNGQNAIFRQNTEEKI